MSGAAPAAARYRAHAAYETRLLLANGEQLLVSLVLPALALLALALGSTPSLGPGRRVDVATAGVFALAIVSTAFTGQAISTGFDRRSQVLRLFGVTPLGRSGLLLGKAGAVAAILAVQVLVLGGLAAALGWRPVVAGLLPALLAALLGAFAFVALGLLLAGTLRAEAVLAVANLLWVLFLGAGLLLPTSLLPAGIRQVAVLLPSGALGDALRAALVEGRWHLGALAVLALWGLVAAALTRRFFRWGP